MKNFPLELIDIICSCINKKLLRDISFEKNKENPLYILNRKRIEIHWRKSGIYRLAGNVNDLKGIKYLIKQGVDIREKDIQLLKVASCNGNLEIIKYIIKILEIFNNEKYIITDAIIYAIIGNQLKIIKYLTELEINNKKSIFPVIYASRYGHLEIMKYLVKKGADITDCDNWPIQIACEYGHLEMIKYLVKKGADITDSDNRALKMAKKYNHLEIVKYINSLYKWPFYKCKIKKFFRVIFSTY